MQCSETITTPAERDRWNRENRVEVMVETSPGHWIQDFFSSREHAEEFFQKYPEYQWNFVIREESA